MPILAGQILRAADLAEMMPVGTTYTPVNSGLTIGNGTLEARYMLIGKMCHVVWYFVFGGTSALVADLSIGLPFPVGGAARAMLPGDYRDVGTRSTALMAIGGAGSTIAGVRYSGTGNNGLVNGTNPQTPVATDNITISGVYEIA